MKGVDDVYPLTPSQLGILVDTLRDPDPELYFEQVCVDIVGDVDPSTLHSAWCDTIEHHPALRTVWLWEGLDDPVQVVRSHVDLPWTVLDWTSVDEPRQRLADLAADDRLLGFDLARPPVTRVTVIRLADDRLHVVWSFHHIMLDGWSTALVLDEILGRCGGAAVEPAPPFRDHVAWIGNQDREAADLYWQRQLEGFDEPNRLARGTHDPNTPFVRERTGFHLDQQTAADLADAARSHRITVNTLVQAAWAVTLSCYTGDRDVVFGVTNSGRPAEVPGVESIAGMFLSTLPMRVRFGDDRTVVDLWRDVQAQQLDLTQYQYSSLADISRSSSVAAGVGLFETALVFENFPRPDDHGRSVSAEHLEVFEQTRFPVTVMVGTDSGLEVLALYDAAQFERSAIDQVLSGFRRVMTAMAADPSAPSDSITPLTEAERRRLVADINQTDAEPIDSTVHAEIAARAEAHPDDVALVDGSRQVSYRDLTNTAQTVSRHLVGRGVAAGDVVAIALDRSVEAVVCALGAMNLGAAYLAIDPATPRARLDSILDDAAPAAVIVDAKQVATFENVDSTVIDVAELLDEPSAGDGDLQVTGSADDTMFVVFTSGSTGRPKGVPGTHRAVLNRCAWEAAAAPYEPGEVACQKTTFDFVDHVAELWAPLVNGRTVAIIGDATVRDPVAFVEALAGHRIRRIVMVPSLLEVLLDAVPDIGTRLAHLRRWTLSGESLPAATADRFMTLLPHATLVNMYGMSEVMADATAFELTSSDTRSAGPIPIGRPIRNQRIYVLDQVGRPTPVGVPGQIWISGAGLMNGYWHRDDLTAERIGPNPFGGSGHELRYATGDVGRWTEDAQLDYVGRLDRQVKVRGVRVELGDVEAAVRSLTDVRDAVVIDASNSGDSTRLVGFVTTDGEFDAADARRRLADIMPSALVPADVVEVDEIPLLPSGKVDRHALADRAQPKRPDRTDHEHDDEDLATMIAIWREVIGTDRIGPDDDFFDAGGHSIAGIRLLTQIKRRYDVNLELAVLYAAATPSSLLHLVSATGDQDPSERATRHLVPISTGSDARRMIYCVHGAGGNVLNLRDLAHDLGPTWGMTGIQASGVDGVSPLHESLAEMCDAYIDEVLADRSGGPLFLAGFSGGGIIAFEMATRLADRGRAVDAVILLDTFHPTVRARRRTVAEHATALMRQGPGYLRERQQVRKQRNLYVNADSLVLPEAGPDQPVPHELRDAVVANNTVSLLDRYDPRTYDGAVIMYAATDVIDVLRHGGPDRGWTPWAPTLRCRAVPGTHHDFVLAPNARHLATRMRDDLERTLVGDAR